MLIILDWPRSSDLWFVDKNVKWVFYTVQQRQHVGCLCNSSMDKETRAGLCRLDGQVLFESSAWTAWRCLVRHVEETMTDQWSEPQSQVVKINMLRFSSCNSCVVLVPRPVQSAGLFLLVARLNAWIVPTLAVLMFPNVTSSVSEFSL
jgi:hypothetical protein